MAKALARFGDGIAQGKAKRNGDILEHVVAQVAMGRYGEIQASIAGERGKHMVQKRLVGSYPSPFGSWLTNRNSHVYFGFGRFPRDLDHVNACLSSSGSMAPV